MKKEIALLIRKFLVGKTDPEEDRKLNEWYRKKRPLTLLEKDWLKIKRKIWHKIESRRHPVPEKKFVIGFRQAIAACVTVLLVSAAGYFLYQHKNDLSRFFSRQSSTTYTMYTGFGEIKEIRLPDGTLVWLNDRTDLRYTSDFGKKTREVRLEGEAYFEVERDPVHPFLVQTDQATVRVLGTHFNVKSYPGGKKEIGVSKGVVSVHINEGKAGSKSYKLYRCDGLEYDPRTGNILREYIDPESLSAWKDDVLIFNAQPLSEVAETLERHYGTSIKIADRQTADQPFSGIFRDKTLESVLHALEYSMKVEAVKQKGNSILIRSHNQ